MNDLFEAGVSHMENCKNCKHDKINSDGVLLFYTALSGGLLMYDADVKLVTEAGELSMKEMKNKYNIL